MIDLTPVVTVLLAALLAACTSFVVTKLVPEIKKLAKPFTDKWPTDAAFIEQQIDIAVSGVEKKFGPGQGDLKLPAALQFVESQARRYGYTFDADTVDVMIHAKLHNLEVQAAAALAGK